MSKRKKSRRAIRRPFETGAYRLFRFFVPLLPRKVVIGFAHLVGVTAVRIPFRMQKIALKNLDAVFGDTRTQKEKRQILASSFSTVFLTMLDSLWFLKNPDKRIRKYVTIEEGEKRDAFFKEGALVCITAHFGNWELLGQTTALYGAPMASLAAPIQNPAIDRLVTQQRESIGQIILPREGALKSLIGRLRKKGKIAFLLDQNTPAKKGGVWVDFLGLPTPISSAPAMLAYRTGTKILVGLCRPTPEGGYHVYIPDIISPPPYEKGKNAEEEAQRLTQQIMDSLSREIRAYPEYWLWAYKHWRYPSKKAEVSNYPDYSR